MRLESRLPILDWVQGLFLPPLANVWSDVTWDRACSTICLFTVYKTLRLSPSSAPSPTPYVSLRPLRAAAPLSSIIDINKNHPTFLGSHNYYSILTHLPSISRYHGFSVDPPDQGQAAQRPPDPPAGIWSECCPAGLRVPPHRYCCCTPGRPADMKCPKCSSGRRENPPSSAIALVPGSWSLTRSC